MNELSPGGAGDTPGASDTRIPTRPSVERADQFLTLAEVSRAVASILDLDALFDKVVSIIHRQFGYPFVHLYIVDPVRNQIIYRAGRGARSTYFQERGLVYRLDAPEGIIPWVARNGSTVVANDVSRDPRYRAAEMPTVESQRLQVPEGTQPPPVPPVASTASTDPRAPDTRAELTVPLVFRDRVLGVLDVQSGRRNAFDEDSRLLFEALADSVAIAIRNANLYRSERWRRQVADSLHQVAGLLSEEVLLEEVLDTILVELERTLPCDLAAIWLLEDDELHVAAIRGPDVYAFTADTILSTSANPSVSAWVSQALSSERPLVRSPGSPPDPLGDALEFPADHSAIAIPLRAADQRLGLLTLAHRIGGQYGAESQAVMATFASYAAVAIQNTRLYQDAQEQALVSTVMLQVAGVSQSAADVDQVLTTVARLASQLTSANRCAIFLWDDAITGFVPAAAHGLDASESAILSECQIQLGDVRAFDELLATGAATILCDMQDEPISTVYAPGFESLLLLPLLSQGLVLGAMLVECEEDLLVTGTSESLLDQRMAILQGIAHQAAAAVENGRLREAQQMEAYVSAALLQVSQAVNSLNELDDILSTIVRIMPILVGVDYCMLYVWDEESEVFRLAHAYGLSQETKVALAKSTFPSDVLGRLEEARYLTFGDTGSSIGSLSTSGSPYDEQSTTHASNVLPREIAEIVANRSRNGSDALLAVPLSFKGEVLGAMLLAESLDRVETGVQRGYTLPESAKRRFSTQGKRIEIITGIAHQAAMAVQNERFQQERLGRERLERELQLAREIQRIFIPSQLPNLKGWELAARWQAAHEVAGDFYDLVELPGRKLGLVVADVADKGMPAALFMALTRTLVRAVAIEESSPATVLMRVNNLLAPDAQGGMFVTAAYAILCLETGELCYANAGHCLPLVLRSSSQTLCWLPKGGTALGVLARLTLTDHVIRLAPGDSLIFYTDGITEAFSPDGELFGACRMSDVMQSILQTAGSHSAQALLDSLLSAVGTFTEGGPLSDDLTAVVLSRSRRRL